MFLQSCQYKHSSAWLMSEYVIQAQFTSYLQEQFRYLDREDHKPRYKENNLSSVRFLFDNTLSGSQGHRKGQIYYILPKNSSTANLRSSGFWLNH